MSENDALWAVAEPFGATALWYGLDGYTVDAPDTQTARKIRRAIKAQFPSKYSNVRVIVCSTYPSTP